MSVNLVGRMAPALSAITERNGETRHRRRVPGLNRLHYNPTPVVEAAIPAIPADNFYDRLQRIWNRVLLFEDLGVIHTEFDKFRYAYQLAEAELQGTLSETDNCPPGLMLMEIYQNEHLTLSVNCHIHLIEQAWFGVPTTESYRAGSLAALQLAEQHQLKRWLIDQRQLRLFRPKDLQWFIEEWLPLAAFRLPDRVVTAIVLTDLNQFSKLGSDMVLRAALMLNAQLQTRYFTDMQEARTWLTTKRYPAPVKPAFPFE